MCYFSLTELRKSTIIDLEFIDYINISIVKKDENRVKIEFFDKWDVVIHEAVTDEPDKEFYLVKVDPSKETF